SLVGAALLALGTALAGWWIGQGFREGRAADRYAAVKGLAEREVVADLALWPIRFVVTDNDLAKAQKDISEDTQRLMSFLARTGHPRRAGVGGTLRRNGPPGRALPQRAGGQPLHPREGPHDPHRGGRQGGGGEPAARRRRGRGRRSQQQLGRLARWSLLRLH